MPESYFFRFRNLVRDQARIQLQRQLNSGEIDQATYTALNRFYDINAEDNTPLNKALCKVLYGTATANEINALRKYFWN